MVTTDISADQLARIAPRITLALLVAYLVIAVVQRVALFGDGSYMFLWSLEHQKPLQLAQNRFFAQAFTQSPLLAALKLGVTHARALELLFAVGLFLHFPVALWICARAAAERRELLFFPLASFFAASANGTFFIVAESHLLVSLFWSFLFVLLVPRTWSAWWLALALVLALLAVAAYETMVVLGLILAGASGWRARQPSPWWLRTGSLVVGVLCLTGVAVALRFILHPNVETNRLNFLVSLLPVVDWRGHIHGAVLLSFLAVALLIAAFAPRQRGWRVGAIVFAFGCAAWALSPVLAPTLINPGLHYNARTLNLTVTLVLAGLFLFVWARPVLAPSAFAWKRAWGIVVALALCQTVWFTLTAAHWQSYLRLVQREANARAGLHPFEDSQLKETLIDGRPVNALNWVYAIPALSLLMAPGGQVRGLVDQPAFWKGWRPFDPAKPGALAYMRRYGFNLDEYEAALTAGRTLE